MPRHSIRLLYVIPIHDLVSLTIFEDNTAGITDCKLLVNHHMELTSAYISNSERQDDRAYLSLKAELEEEIDQSDYREYPDGETITVSLDDKLRTALLTWCEDHRITAEKMMHALIRFTTEENVDIIRTWVNDFKREHMEKTVEIAKANEIAEDEFQADFDNIMEKVEKGMSPISILCNSGQRLLMFEWEDYWRRIGWLSGEDRAAIERECQNAQDSN